MNSNNEPARKRTPFSAKLPQVSLADAVSVADTLADLAAPATPAVIAQQMGTSTSSSGFKTKIAAAGYYGLVEVDGAKRTLTERGTDITSGDADRVPAAKADAVMSTNFGPILHSLRARVANEAIVSSRLQGDFGVPAASAEYLAGVLIESAEQAGLMTDGRFDAVTIENHASVLPAPTQARPSSPPSSASSITAVKPKTEQKGQAPDMRVQEESTGPFVAPPVQIVLNLDASKLSAEQIATLVKALQTP